MTLRIRVLTPLSAILALGVITSFAGEAAAQQRKKATVVEVGDITISAYVPKPVAAVDINRIAPKLSLTELRQPFLDKIEQAILKDPF